MICGDIFLLALAANTFLMHKQQFALHAAESGSMWVLCNTTALLSEHSPQCPECHEEKEDHPLAKSLELAFMCKKCKRAFRKDMAVFEDSDEYCPHCDNHFVGITL